MINVSDAFRNQIENDNRDYLIYIDIELADGTKLPIANKDIWGNGCKIENAVSGISCFDIGAAVIGKLTLTISNLYEEFSEYNFEGAIVTVILGLRIPSGIEKIHKGVFTVDEPTYDSSTITLECLDNMHKFQKPYSKSKLIYPATIGTIIADACQVCGVALGTTVFEGSNKVITSRPDEETITFLQIVAWCSQICCKFAVCDEYGRLAVKWYDLATYEKSKSIDDNTDKFIHIHSTSSLNVCTDDVVITGINLSVKDGQAEREYRHGNEGYILSISGNKLISTDDANTVVSMIGEKMVGVRFRPYSCSCLNDPTIEAGDLCWITDRKGRNYKSFITTSTFQVGNFQTLECNAETPLRNSAPKYTNAMKTLVETRKNVEKQISDYDKVVQQMTQLMSQGFGMYLTGVQQEDGSIIYYMHDKPTIEESAYTCHWTSEGIIASLDGGTTWAIDKNGNALYNVITARGINAEWIKTGKLIVKDKSGDITFSVDIDTGRVNICADSFSLSGKTIDDIAVEVNETAINAVQETASSAMDEAKKAKALVVSLSNEFEGIPTDSNGNYSQFPECKTVITVFYGSNNVSNNVVYEITKSNFISGTWEKNTKTYTVTGLSGDSGWVDIKATYLSNITATKRFSIVKQKQGYPGQDGEAGTDGVGITGIVEHYAVSASKKTVPSSWQGTPPEMTSANKYLWNYETVTYTDKTAADTAKRIIGAYGDEGIPGSAGKGIKSIVNHYLATASASGVNANTSGWTDAIQSITATKKYLWNYETVTYTDNSFTSTIPCIIGVYGDKGPQGTQGIQGPAGANGNTSYFHVKYSAVLNPTTASQITETPSAYIGTYVDYTQADSTDPKKYKWARFQGEQGIPGVGTDGKTSYLHIKYSNDGGKTFTSNSGETAGAYIGQYVDFVEADSTSVSKYTWNLIKGKDGAAGAGGLSVVMGNDSQNIPCNTSGNASAAAIIEIPFYGYKGTAQIACTCAVGTLPTGVTLSSNTAATASAAGKIVLAVASGATMGNSATLTGSITLTFTLDNKSVARKFTWTKSKAGAAGASARTYFINASSLVIKKSATNTLTPASVTFSSFYRTGTSATRTAYAGRFKIEESTDGTNYTVKYTSGADESSKAYTPSSTGVVAIKCTLYAAGGTTTALDTQSVTIVSDGKNGATGATGAPGKDGNPGRVYILESNVDIIKCSKDDKPVPETIKFTSYYRDGSSATRTAYSGRFVIEESADGINWTAIYESNVNESSASCTLNGILTAEDNNVLTTEDGEMLTTENIGGYAQLRCSLYSTGKGSKLDIKTVPVVKDVDALSHDEIFDLLTNNGKVKGIFQEGDQLYVSFNYMKGGKLVLGGRNNGQGEFSVLNSSGLEIVKAGKDGLAATSGNIAGWKIDSSQLFKSVDLYPNMTAEGLANLDDNDPVQYCAWIRKPVDGNTPVFGVYYQNKIGYLNNSGNVYRKFAAYANGRCYADNFYSSSAKITGGSIKVNTSNSNFSFIDLAYDDYKSRMSPYQFVAEDGYGSSSMNSGGIIVEDKFGKTHVSGSSVILDGGSISVGYNTNVSKTYVSTDNITCSSVTANSLNVSGSKHRIVETDNYGTVCMNAVESPEAYFTDIGSAVIGETGSVAIFFDQEFCETIDLESQYRVFITEYESGKITKIEKKQGYFIVYGEGGAGFDWLIYVKQKGYEGVRMNKFINECDTSTNILDFLSPEKDMSMEILKDALLKYEKEITLI